jgi:hypothetical protein
MKDTFSFWSNVDHRTLPLLINPGTPSECRLLARGNLVYIYQYTQSRRQRQAALNGIQQTTPSTPPHTMAKKAPAAPAKKMAAPKAAAKKTAKPAPMGGKAKYGKMA